MKKLTRRETRTFTATVAMLRTDQLTAVVGGKLTTDKPEAGSESIHRAGP
jgi:hypothetical protein